MKSTLLVREATRLTRTAERTRAGYAEVYDLNHADDLCAEAQRLLSADEQGGEVGERTELAVRTRRAERYTVRLQAAARSAVDFPRVVRLAQCERAAHLDALSLKVGLGLASLEEEARLWAAVPALAGPR